MAIQGASKTSCRAAYEKFGDGTVKDISDDIPFEIPEGWSWVRFGSITLNRDAERIPLSKEQRFHLAKNFDYYGASGIIDKVDKYLFDKPLLLVGEDGANLLARSTPIAFIASGKYWVNNHAHVIDAIEFDLLKYLEVFINAIPLTPYITGTAQPKMNQDKMNGIVVALPPLTEQRRIVAKIEELLAVVDSLGEAADNLESDAKRLDKKILDLAIRGKLVPQDPNDEPASELVKRIAASHKSPCKNQSEPIDPPFDIPDSWEWVRLGKIISLLSGRDLAPQNYSSIPQTYPYMTGASNFSNGELLVNRWTNVPATISHNGDLLITCKGTVGVMAINTIGDIHIARQIMAISSSVVDLHYVKVFLSAIVSSLKATATSMIPGIDRSAMLNLLIPLPPLNEQKRIVKRVEELKATTRTLVTF